MFQRAAQKLVSILCAYAQYYGWMEKSMCRFPDLSGVVSTMVGLPYGCNLWMAELLPRQKLAAAVRSALCLATTGQTTNIIEKISY
jgi:hypothetical protein